MSEDNIREESQMNSLDHMASLGKAALTAGVSAALFYRGGGKKILSRGARISERVLRDTKNEIGSRNLKNLTTKDAKDMYDSLIKSSDSSLNKALETVEEGAIRLRKDDTRNIVGGIQENYLRILRDQRKFIEGEYRYKNVELPTANEFTKRYAENNPELGRQIERFSSDAVNHLNDLVALDDIIKRHKLDRNLSAGQVNDMLEFMQKRMDDKDGFSQFEQGYKKVIDEAISMSIDPDEMARVYGTKRKPTAKQKFEDTLLGDQRATIDDLINNPEEFAGNKVFDHVVDDSGRGEEVVKEATTFLKELKEKIRQTKGENKASAFGDLYVDGALRKGTDGEFYSFAENMNLIDNFMESFGGTMPGKIMKLRDIRGFSTSPSFEFTKASASVADPMLARLANRHNKESFVPDTSFMRIYDKTYEFSKEGLKHESALDDTVLNYRYGTATRLLNNISGNVEHKEAKTKIARVLDIGQEATPTILDDIKSRIKKTSDPRWSKNIVDDFLNNSYKNRLLVDEYKQSEIVTDEAANNIKRMVQQSKDLDMFFSKNTYELNSEAVNKLMNNSSGETKRLFKILTLSDEDMLTEMMVKDASSIRDITSYLNQGLISALSNYSRNPRAAREIINQKSSRDNFIGGKETANFFDILRTEIGKEAFMRHATDSATENSRVYNFDAISELIDSAGLNDKTKRETRRLADWAVFQQATGVNKKGVYRKELDDLMDNVNDVLEVFIEREDEAEPNKKYFDQFRENLRLMSKDKISTLETSYQSFKESTDIVSSDRLDQRIHMKRMVSPLDVIKDLNDTEKLKAFGKQFYAGRDNLEDVTTATLVPYFGLLRLSDAVSKIGLGFSVTSTASVGSIASSIAMKRTLPLIAGMTYFDYLSDVTGEVTGTSLKGAMASGVANIDLGFRKITDATGITGLIQDEKEINPLLRYWTGKEYMDYDERKEWYEDGYSEMRKARWWNFGSINEWRGPEIQYYQPNYLRRAHSNWKDESLYDSTWEKWSRSWLPTPTAPLSPVRYLMNPYWLEEKHSEDRPYPMTGKMFTEETPWGPFLNPTIGEIIKPQRRMHADRLGGNFVDVKALIEERNQEQFKRAKDSDDSHLIRLKDGVIEPVSYTTLNAPTPSQRILNLEVGDGQVKSISGEDYQSVSGLMPVQSYLDEFSSASAEGARAGTSVLSGQTGVSTGGETIEGLSFEDEMMIKADSGDLTSGIISSTINRLNPMSEIEQVNRNIYTRANALGASRPNEKGVVTPESIYRSQARYGSHILDNKEAKADLKGLTSGDDFIGELAYTSRFMAGIYGYGTFRLLPGEPRTKIEDASTMTSPIRSFWDTNIGGLGGGYVEIFRRFTPAFNHKVEKINPLMNTMPDWMPERFRYGDPYTHLPKGEMRLPGKGYESLNELNPDEYGAYGAFDRFKILADISPYSQEYKVWRDIASKTVQDPELREEMGKIRERVTEQSKKYDFDNYKFIGKKVDRNVVRIEEVMNNNYFRVVGDDRVYRLAGIDVGAGQDGEDVLGELMSPGMEVVMATDRNQYDGTNDDTYESVNASIFIQGQNINRQLLKDGIATKRDNDRSAAATIGTYTDFQIARGYAWEAISHAPIPYFQQKYFKIRDPLESYKHEQVYGTSYASWTFPIKSYLQPAVERSLMSDGEMAVGLGSLALNQIVHNVSSNRKTKNLANAGLMLTNRGAFIGGFLGLSVFGGGTATKRMAQVGAAGQMASWLYTRSDQPIQGTIGFGALGAAVGHVFKDIGVKKGSLVGSVAGLALSGAQTSFLHEGLDKTWIPERTKDKWDLQEYFDRLEYIKYSGLYEKAARKAYLKEGTDIKKLVHQYDKSNEENDKLREELNERKQIVKNIYSEGDTRAEKLLEEIDSKLNAIDNREILMSTGRWGRTALIYKQAMDSTVYGLKKDASWAQLLRAIPSNERDHFMEFAKEKDPKKREEILKYVSPYQKKALQIAWEEEPEEQESMKSYFGRHKLPTPTWSGWRPNIDIKDIKVKTIANEGMLLSDFGHFESQLRDPDVIHADTIDPNDSSMPAVMRMNLLTALKGYGLTGVDVSVEPSEKKGIQVVADITRMTAYNVQEKIKNIVSF